MGTLRYQINVLHAYPRYNTRDYWMQESIKQILNSALFWAVRAEWKKIQTAISMLLLRSVFLCFRGRKNNLD